MINLQKFQVKNKRRKLEASQQNLKEVKAILQGCVETEEQRTSRQPSQKMGMRGRTDISLTKSHRKQTCTAVSLHNCQICTGVCKQTTKNWPSGKSGSTVKH